MQHGDDKVFHFKKDKFSKDIILKHLKEYLNIFLPSHPSFIFALHLAWWGFSDIKNYILILLTFCSSCWVGRPAVSVAKKEIYLHNAEAPPPQAPHEFSIFFHYIPLHALIL